MVKYPTSNKTSFGKKPYIKKGYYPAQLIKVEPYTDKEGKLKEGKYGRQLIFEFAIFAPDVKTGAPLKPMTFKEDSKSTESVNVIIPKFVYHQYKNKSGEFDTAITPNSAITKLLKALGWTFSEEPVDPEDYKGSWVEVNIDDFETGEGEEKYTASSIKDVGKYKGPEPSKDLVCVKPEEPKKVEKQIKHEAIKKEESSGKDVPKDEGEIKKLEAKIENLKSLNKEGLLTNDGLKQAIEQLETKIEELKKK